MATKDEIQADYKERVARLTEKLKELNLTLVAIERVNQDGYITKEVAIQDLKQWETETVEAERVK